MKKKLLFVIPILIVLIISLIIFILFSNKKVEPFDLDSIYYGSNELEEIDLDELNSLVENKETFGIFIYQSLCSTSSEFEKVLDDFQEQYQISFKKIAFSKVKDTDVASFLNYYPSFIIYKDGKMVDFLEADKDEDLKYYQSVEGFKEWFTKYVNLKNNDSSENQTSDSDSQTSQNENSSISKIDLDYIVQEENKVNIYFFWGNGCPHCEQEFEFFENISKEYQDKYNLYTFEVWYDEENAELLKIFASAMGDNVKGIPYTIIGNKSFSGFNSNSKSEFEEAIKSQYKNSYDIYFDKLK